MNVRAVCCAVVLAMLGCGGNDDEGAGGKAGSDDHEGGAGKSAGGGKGGASGGGPGNLAGKGAGGAGGGGGGGGTGGGGGQSQQTVLFDFKVAQIVEAATPDAIDGSSGTSTAGQSEHALTVETLINRFTDDVYTMMTGFTMRAILQSFDNRLSEINMRAASGMHDCLATPADAQTIATPDGQSFTIYPQCHEGLGGVASSNFVIFGKAPDDAWTVYERSPAGVSLIHAAETEPDAGTYDIDAYFAIFPQEDGSGSGLLVHVHANSAAMTAQWTGAYNTRICGISYYADASHVFLRGSVNDEDQGGGECADELSGVYDADDLAPDETTPFDESKIFTGDEFIRRVSSTLPAAGGGTGTDTIEAYPGGGNVRVTKGATADEDATDLNFGPESADALGSGAFSM